MNNGLSLTVKTFKTAHCLQTQGVSKEESKDLHFNFALGPANYVSGPKPSPAGSQKAEEPIAVILTGHPTHPGHRAGWRSLDCGQEGQTKTSSTVTTTARIIHCLTMLPLSWQFIAVDKSTDSALGGMGLNQSSATY